MEFMPLRKDPQDFMSIEESKEEAALDITFWMEKLSNAIKKRTKDKLEKI
jgi:hypothetical protein